MFEDDATRITHDITERLDILRCLKDWDYVALGYNIDSVLEVELSPGFKSTMLFAPKQPTDETAAAFQRSTTEVAALRLTSCFGTAGYVVSPRGAKKLLELCLPMENRFLKIPVFNRTIPVMGVDGMMNFIYGSIEAFACLSPLVIPRNNNACVNDRSDRRNSPLVGLRLELGRRRAIQHVTLAPSSRSMP